MIEDDPSWLESMRTLVEAASPAVLVTRRRDGMPLPSPVWFRYHGHTFEVVVAAGDVKARHLARNPSCALVVFEAVSPFRGIEVRGDAMLVSQDVTEARTAIASRYLGAERGARFAREREADAILVRLSADGARSWDLAPILPCG